ncbi:MAG: ADP-glyceromanno-heptose 6-epimerase [Proteobacteria bacterium]|nr:ADP-glyceromanno-heptose 6-epimerase [Pseudomonadota bacterium]
MIVITGGAGFIGSNLAAALAQRGERVAICDRLGADGQGADGLGAGGKWRNIAKLEIEDVVPPDQLLAFLSGAADRLRALVHLGAISDTTARDGDALVETNFRLPARLWAFCAEHNKPFIYASSAATYGDGAEGFDDDASIEHLARLRPLNAYGWSKLLFDRWVARRLADGGPVPLQWAGLRFFNVYGPNEYHKGAQASVASHLYRQVAAGEPARLFQSHRPDYPDGGQKRDFIWVGDCVEVMLWLLENRQVNGLFNLGTGKARSFADLARALFAALDRPENVQYVPTPEEIRDKYQYFTEARMERLRAAGYEPPFTELEDGVRRYVRDHLAAADPYR